MVDFVTALDLTCRTQHTVPFEGLAWVDIDDAGMGDLDAALTKQDDVTLRVGPQQIVIPYQSIRGLVENKYLDDIVVCEWGRLLRHRAEVDTRFLPVFSLSTHWPLLQSIPTCSVEKYAVILFPTHISGNHWILLWLDMVEETLFVYDPLALDNARSPTVDPLVRKVLAWFDSLAGFPRHFRVKTAKGPVQSDGTNCGVWISIVQDAICRDLWLHEIIPWSASSTIMHTARRYMAACLVSGKIFV